MTKANASGVPQEAYLDLVDDTECPLLFHRWALIAVIGSLLGRRVYLKFGTQTIYPNQYVVLLGPAASRKSTAIRIASELMERAGYENFSGDKTGTEKFIADLAEGFNNLDDDELGEMNLFGKATTEAECFIKAGELEDFMGPSNGDFISLLTNLWDTPAIYKHRLKSKQSEKVYKPTVSMLGGATQTTFTNIFPPGIVGQGMLSRMLLIYGSGQRKKIAWPEPLSEEAEIEFTSLLGEIYTLEGEMKVTDGAKEVLGSIYHKWHELDDERFENYSGRRHTHLLKLCMVTAASNLRTEITRDDVLYSNTLLTYTEQYMPKALGEFGHSDDSKKLYSVLKIIKKHPAGLTPAEIIKVTANLALRPEQLSAIIENLRRMDKLDIITVGETRKYIATHEVTDNSESYCNFEWLREYQEEAGSPPVEGPDNLIDEFTGSDPAHEEEEYEQQSFKIS